MYTVKETDKNKKTFSVSKAGCNQYLNRNCYRVDVVREDWCRSTCTCSFFRKNYYCYHTVAVAVDQRLYKIPEEYHQERLLRAKNRGDRKKLKVGKL